MWETSEIRTSPALLSEPAELTIEASARNRIPTWVILTSLGIVQIVIAWIYDKKIMTPAAMESIRSSSRLPRELSGVLSGSHTILIHYATTLVIFVLALGFLACCIQLALLALGKEANFEHLFRATTIASIPLAIGSFITAIEILRAGGGLTGLRNVRPPPSLATLFLVPSSASGSQLFLLLSMATVFEAAWGGLLILQLLKIASPRKACAAVSIVWVVLTLGKWALLSFATRLLA